MIWCSGMCAGGNCVMFVRSCVQFWQHTFVSCVSFSLFLRFRGNQTVRKFNKIITSCIAKFCNKLLKKKINDCMA